MTRPSHIRAPKRAHGTCRNRRRPQGSRRPAWVRTFRRVHRAIDSSVRLIETTLRMVAASERCVHEQPIRTSRNLDAASGRLLHACARLGRAIQVLADTTECLAREPEHAAAAPKLLFEAAARAVCVGQWLAAVAGDVFAFHENVLHGLATGVLVPERPDDDGRPRIVLAPRPVPIRAFLLLRQPRVIDRIASILRWRRRTPVPAAIRVPKRSLLGRAPPLPSICLL